MFGKTILSNIKGRWFFLAQHLGPCSKKQEMILNNESTLLITGGAAGS